MKKLIAAAVLCFLALNAQAQQKLYLQATQQPGSLSGPGIPFVASDGSVSIQTGTDIGAMGKDGSNATAVALQNLATKASNKLALGNIAAPTGVNHLTVAPATDWLSALTFSGASGIFSQSYIITDPASIYATQATPTEALVLGNQSLGGVSTGPNTYSTPRVLELQGFNNVTVAPSGGGPKVPLWLMYSVGYTTTTQAGETFGWENEMYNSAAAPDVWTPYSAPAGTATVNLALECGAGLSAVGQFNCTNPLYFAANPMPFSSGMIFFPGSIDATGVGGSHAAIMMPSTYSQQWWNVGGVGAIINSDASGNFVVTVPSAAALNLVSGQSVLNLISSNASNSSLEFYSSTSTLNAGIVATSGGSLLFATGVSGTERFRVTSGGGLAVGTTTGEGVGTINVSSGYYVGAVAGVTASGATACVVKGIAGGIVTSATCS